MKNITRRNILAALGAGALAWLPGVHAQTAWPTKPVTIVVAYAGGGSIDVLIRFLTEQIRKRHPEMVFVLEYRPGAGGNIAAEFVAKAANDGHTFLLAGSSTHAANVSLYKTLGFDPEKDFAPVSTLAAVPYFLIVNPAKVPVNNLAEFVTFAKANPGKLNYGSSAITGRLAGEIFNQRANIKTTFVPYKNLPQVVSDVLGGHIDYVIGDPQGYLPHVRSGRLRALAVTTRNRVAAASDVPSFAESGYRDFDVSAWLAIWGKSGMPADGVARFNRLLNEIINSPEGQAFISNTGLLPMPGSAQELGERQKRDTVTWGQVIRSVGIAID